MLKTAADAELIVKSGLMLGLGETPEELKAVFKDLVQAGCGILTLGQYLAPEEFDRLAVTARLEGVREVLSGPFVRSSYRAGFSLSSLKGQTRDNCDLEFKCFVF